MTHPLGCAATVAGRAARGRTRPWAMAGALSVTETVSWGILYYAFAVLLVPMQQDLGWSAAQLTGAFSLGLAVSGLAGIAVGRHLDRHGPRGLMTAGSLGGVGLVLAWSQVDTLAGFYAIWAAMGVVMAAVLYEAAFTVLAKQFSAPGERRRAMTAMTLVAALASFIFLPLTQALVLAHGWRDALVVLAVVLGVTTVPLHALVLRGPADGGTPRAGGPSPAAASGGSTTAGEALRSRSFWLLSAAFLLAGITAIAMTVHTIPFLLQRGHSAAFAAFAVGVIGVAQIPGRLLFAPLAARFARPAVTSVVFGLMAAGVAVVVSVPATWTALAGLVMLGMGNGMATLARATVIADLYGSGAYGTIAGVAASMTTAARAGAPLAAAVLAAAAGYPALLSSLAVLAAIAAVLAHRSERPAGDRTPEILTTG